MAKSKTTRGNKTAAKRGRPKGSGRATSDDAVGLLKADHRKVEELFKEFEAAGDAAQKKKIVQQVCQELVIHTQLEEQIFYPACREEGVESDLLDEAQVEHDGAKTLISELLSQEPDDEFYDAKVTVLAEYIKHHVGEEEKPRSGIFASAQKAGLDMKALGQHLQARKKELQEEVEAEGLSAPQPRSLQTSSQYNRKERNMPRYSNDRDRDEQGRFTSDDDDNGRSRSRYGRSQNQGQNRDRDEYGRFASDDDDDGRSRGRSSGSRSSRDYDDDYDQGRRQSSSGRGQDRDRDEYGRFTSDDDDDRGYSSRSRSSRDDDDSGRGRGRGRSQSQSRSSSRDDDDDRGGRGHGGWFGDSEGHSEASRRGWEERGSSSRSRSSRDDDDDNGRSRSRSQSQSRSGGGGGSRSASNRSRSSRDDDRGHGGWFGDPEGHSEASRRGWAHRE